MRNLFLLAFIALIVFLQINGEKIPVNDGAFGGGVFYRDVARFFLDDIENSSYNLVQLTRILPFALLNLSFSAFHIVKDDEGLRNGMLIWQVVYLGLAIYWYLRIAKKLRLNSALITLGFILFFFNFAWLKSVWYHPFSPDMMAFTMGVGQMNYFLRYEKFKLGMLSVIGAFVSPLLLISGILMLFLPGDKLPLYEGERPKSASPVVFSLFTIIIFSIIGWGIWDWKNEPIVDQVFHGLALLLLPVWIIYVAVNNSLDWDVAIRQLKKRTHSSRLSKGIMYLTGILLILVLLSGNNESLGVFRILKGIGDGVFRFPGDFILSVTLQWGVLVLVTLVYIKRFLQEMGRLGWSICLILMIGVLFLPFFKANNMAAWIPIWGVVVIKSMKRYKWTGKELIFYGVMALGISLTWLPINNEILSDYLTSWNPDLLPNWEVQKWAIHLPEFTSILGYFLIFLVLGGLFYWIRRRRKKYMKVLVN
ncbi:hypothetical protein JYB62_01865 [Algoriphagus lutimaris]|uniref:hypothetical protein n=1 Tax=Algoriphagus lutimaris TaxID=613197 RepID=UPI00196AB092|nr:hypothetical protein [Algoriphagus lutimaris]MBN3518734.1 hypothetical protein [Algoriphagus lutimaris]